MLCILWNCRRYIYYELLPMNETINYCAQLDILKAAIQEKCPGLAYGHGVVFRHDNARPHVSVNMLQKSNGFGWDILNLPPYSPDMAPSDYYMFRSMEHSLCGKNFANLNDIQNHIDDFFAPKPGVFLQNRYRKVTRMMAEGSRKQLTLCNKLKLHLSLRN